MLDPGRSRCQVFPSHSKAVREFGAGDFCPWRSQTCSLFLFLNRGLKAKNWHAVPGFIFFSEKTFQWQFLCIFIFLLAFVALSDGNLYPPASHLKYINVGESVGFQMSSTLTLRIKHFSPSSSLSPFLFRRGRILLAAGVRNLSSVCSQDYYRQPLLSANRSLLKSLPPTPASPQGEKNNPCRSSDECKLRERH